MRGQDETRNPAVGLLLFSLEGQRYALRLASVERVIRAVALNPLPGAPPAIRGIFSLHGQIVPVGDLRRRLGRPSRAIALSDWIVIVRTPSRLLGLLVEEDTAVVDCPSQDIVAVEAVISRSGIVDGIGRLRDGLVLIHDLARFLSVDEERMLAEALDGQG